MPETATARPWLLYGATGYTGQLVLAEALRRGHRPVLAARNGEAVRALAARHGLEARVAALDDPTAHGHPAGLAAALAGMGAVLHCAGPFSATCAPMLEACLAAKVHYADITGEIAVFAHCHAQDARARAAGIAVVAGAGFDVVPTDCLAALLAERLPDATSLVLAFEAGGGLSPGTAKTSVEGLAQGGRVRRGGALVEVPLAWKVRTFLRDGRPRTALTIPWGDVYTAHVTTGIPDVEVYLGAPPSAIRNARRMRLLRPLLRLAPVQRYLQRRVGRTVRGPDESRRGKSGCHLWGEARNVAGTEVRMELDTPNGYDVTAWCAVGIVERLLTAPRPAGYYTPSRLVGPRYILGMPGVALVGG